MNVGLNIKDTRKSKGLSIKDVASILNIANITYNHYETQEKIIPLVRLNDLINYWNISFDYIFGFNKQEQYKNEIAIIDKIKAGNRLKEFRKENNLTQVKLAEVLNTVHPVIVNYEKGKNLIATPFLYTICKKYHVSADYLLGKIDNPKYLK